MMHENECTGHWSMNSESVQQVAKLPSAGGTVLIKGHKGPEAALDGWRSLLSGQLALPGSLSCIHSIIHSFGLLPSIQLFYYLSIDFLLILIALQRSNRAFQHRSPWQPSRARCVWPLALTSAPVAWSRDRCSSASWPAAFPPTERDRVRQTGTGTRTGEFRYFVSNSTFYFSFSHSAHSSNFSFPPVLALQCSNTFLYTIFNRIHIQMIS